MQRVISPPSFGNVLRERDDAAEESVAIEQRRIRPLAGDRPPVFRQVLVDRVRRHVSGAQASQEVFAGLPCRPRQDRLEGRRHAKDFLSGIPEDPFRRGVPIDEPEVAIEQQIRERHPVDLQPQLRRDPIPLRGGTCRAPGSRWAPIIHQ